MAEPKGEWALIEWIRARTAADPKTVLIGPGDDMAMVSLGDEHQFLATVDALLEGTHFDFATATPQQVGYKALAVSLSDVAAMAAKPVCALAWVGLPDDRDMAFAEQLTLGLHEAAERYACPIVGGDVTSWSRPLTIGTTVIARTGGVKPVRRNGARPGDLLFVTGTLGGSVLGRHVAFPPRIAEARKLAATVSLHAMIDLSDGLSTDVGHLARESGVSAEILAEAVPVSDAARELAKKDRRTPLEHALNDGEDFELLMAVGPAAAEALLRANPLADVPLTCVGRIYEGTGVTILHEGHLRRPLEPGGYEHFRRAQHGKKP
jgi:thiamine-monophosphate kinase